MHSFVESVMNCSSDVKKMYFTDVRSVQICRC